MLHFFIVLRLHQRWPLPIPPMDLRLLKDQELACVQVLLEGFGGKEEVLL